MRQIDNMTPEEIETLKLKGMISRNPEGVEANTSGDRQAEDQPRMLPVYRVVDGKERLVRWEKLRHLQLRDGEWTRGQESPLSKGESAHTTLSNAIDYIRSLKSTQAEYADKVQNALDATAAERDKLREQVRELLAACNQARIWLGNHGNSDDAAEVHEFICAAIKHAEEDK